MAQRQRDVPADAGTAAGPRPTPATPRDPHCQRFGVSAQLQRSTLGRDLDLMDPDARLREL